AGQAIRLYLAASITGVLAGLVGAAFHGLLDAAANGLAGLRDALSQAQVAGWAVLMGLGALVLTPALWLVRRWAPEAAGSGIQEVEAILTTARRLRWERVLPVKFVAGTLALGAGLVMGREGPTVHMGAAVGQMTAEGARLEAGPTRTLVAAGAAAGLAAAFNAPLAAIVFVTEELREGFAYSFSALQSVILASVLAVAVSDWWLGQGPDLPIPPLAPAPLAALPLFLLLGFVVGAFGVVFIALLTGSVRAFQRLRGHSPYAVTAALGAGLGALVWFVPMATGGGERLVESLLQGAPGALALVLLLGVRTLTTVGSYGSGLPGGIFAPMLALGTLAGGGFDLAAQALFPELGLNPGLCAVAAMGALFAATVRAPLTGVILVIELTGVSGLALPIILTCLSATFTAEALGGRPVYHLLLKLGEAPPLRCPSCRVMAGSVVLGLLLLVDGILVTRPRPVGVAPDEIAAAVPSASSSQAPLTPSLVAAGPAASPAPSPETRAPLDQATPLSAEVGAPAQPNPQGERFTIQLLTLNSDAHLASFAERHGLVGQLRVQSGHHGGREWYALLLGDFASRDQAKAALAELPPGLRRLKPLVRVMPTHSRPLPMP
ncbi:MAG: H(+)/Cl(-) exchange transporter ClcA, partial [Bdellovibrio bacteriovorus]